jgi:thiol-disulfide isomerase/thioredoxin
LFKLNDASFVYFVTLTLAWFLTYTSNSTSFNTITTLSLLAIPVVLYSIYYQAVVVKKWCPLCLATAGVLLCQSILSYFLNPFNLSFELNGFLVLAISFLTTVILYTNIKPILSSKLSLEKTKVDYYKFKRKFSLFNSLYSNNAFLDTSLGNTNEIVFGNHNAKIEIVAITNPLCGFCKATHQALDNLLKNQVNDIKVTIRFNINTDNKEDLSYKISTALINLYQKDKIACREAMHQIYTNGVDINKWLKTYELYTINSQFKILESEKQWCLDNNINFTPAVYLNNKEYPKEYELSDLSFFMEEVSHLPSSQREETEKQHEKV